MASSFGSYDRDWLAAAALALAATIGGADRLSAQEAEPRVHGEVHELAPDDAGWELTGDSSVGMVNGVPTLQLRTGTAVRRDIEFVDGVIEFRYRGTDERAFLGVNFRVGEDGTGENVYLRLHKSKQPDALQYTPDFAGRGQWQLWHGPGSTAFAVLAPDEWTRVRIEVAGDRAAVTVGSAREPQLVVPELATGRTAGHLSFWANQPGAGMGAPLTAAVRDVRITHGQPRVIPAADPTPPPFGLVRAWAVSPAFLPTEGAIDATPDQAAGPWRRVVARADGLTPLEPAVDRPAGEGAPAVVAALDIESDAERVVALQLGFSDAATVFLDGRPLYAGNRAYSFNFPRRQGLVTLDENTLFLPLRRGTNRLRIVVREVFGGWAIQGRIPEREGIVVRTPADR